MRSSLIDDKINEELEPWAESVDVVGKEVLGSTLVTLNEDNCRYGECLLGDFVTDAMVFEVSLIVQFKHRLTIFLVVFDT